MVLVLAGVAGCGDGGGSGDDPGTTCGSCTSESSCTECPAPAECPECPPPPEPEPGSPLPGVTTCPDDFTRVGDEGARGAFCITHAQQAPAKFLDAMVACFSMVTSTGDIPYLCSMQEWYLACDVKPDVGEIPLSGEINDEEWVAEPYTATTAITMGNGACGKIESQAITSARAYRCCVH